MFAMYYTLSGFHILSDTPFYMLPPDSLFSRDLSFLTHTPDGGHLE